MYPLVIIMSTRQRRLAEYTQENKCIGLYLNNGNGNNLFYSDTKTRSQHFVPSSIRLICVCFSALSALRSVSKELSELSAHCPTREMLFALRPRAIRYDWPDGHTLTDVWKAARKRGHAWVLWGLEEEVTIGDDRWYHFGELVGPEEERMHPKSWLSKRAGSKERLVSLTLYIMCRRRQTNKHLSIDGGDSIGHFRT